MKYAIRKKALLLLMLAVSGMAQAQSLKDALYSGRLKSQPGMIIRKGDDLSQFIDTTTKAPLSDSAKALAKAQEAEARKQAAPMDLATMNRNNAAAAKAAPASTAKPATTPAANTGNVSVAAAADSTEATAATTETEVATEAATEPAPAAPAAPAKPKDNNAIWKDYMNSVVPVMQSELMNGKKIKKGTYYASVSYTIETDGQVTISDVLLTPENEGLKKQIKDRIEQETPQLTPVVNSSGTPRKVTRKYNFTLTKD